MTDVTPPPAPPATPTWEDLVDMFTSPRAVFERRKDDPQFFVGMLLLTILIGAISIASWDLLQPIRQTDGIRGVEAYLRAHPALPADQAEQIRSRATSGGSLGRWLGWLLAPVGMLAAGLGIWVGAKIVRAKTTIAQAFLIGTYTSITNVVALLASIILAVTLPDTLLNTAFHLTLSPALLVSPDAMLASKLVLFARFDLTAIWSTALVAIGIKATGETTTGRAAAAAILIWAFTTLLIFSFLYGIESLQGLH